MIAESEKDKEEYLKNLAQGYLNAPKEAGGGLSCCAPGEQSRKEGSISCPCGPNHDHDHYHHHHQNINQDNNKDAYSLPAAPDTRVPTFNLLLVGDSGVGKTSLLKKHLTGMFEELYTPTEEMIAGPMLFLTNLGVIQFNVWDSPGGSAVPSNSTAEKIIGTFDDTTKDQIQCAIIMFDVTNRTSYENAISSHKWGDINGILRSGNSDRKMDIPVVFLGNKCDLAGDRVVKQLRVTQDNQQYYDVSIKDGTNTELPFLFIAQRLTGISDLRIVRPTDSERKQRREQRQKRRAKGKLKKSRRRVTDDTTTPS